MKRIAGLLISAAVGLSLVPCSYAAPVEFTDLDDPTVAWAVDYINDMAELGFVTGYEDGTYLPHKSVTRHEVFALMARVLGSGQEANAEVVAAAVEKYEPMLKLYSIEWGIEEFAFLLHKGVITETDLKTYMSGNLKKEAMPRGEIAVILTKTVDGEEDAKNSSYIVTYNDLSSISTTLRPYVRYVSEKGLMNGMDDGNFSPETSVLRSQIAAILSRVHEMIDIKADIGKADTIDETSKSVSYYDEDDMLVWTSYTDEVDVTIEGEPSKLSLVEKGARAVFTTSGEELISIDVLENTEENTFTAKYVSRSVAGGVVKITFKELTGDKRTRTLDCVEGYELLYNGSPSAITAITDGDMLEISTVGDKIVSISAKPGSEKIAGAKVESIETDPDYLITISHTNPEYDGQTYIVSENVSVIKNTEAALLSEVSKGDTVTLTIRYGEVTAITAFSENKNTSGVIKSITIASTPKMVVTIDGKDNEYTISRNASMTIDGEEAEIYDYRVGDTVTMTLDGTTVTKLSATAGTQSTTGSIEGKVVAVNPSYGFIKIEYKTEDGTTAQEQVYVTASTNIMTSGGSNIKLKDIKVGSTASAHGTIKSGAFSARVLVVTE